MKLALALAFALAALVIAVPASASRSHAAATKVTVVMHDPGCHWFAVNGKFTKTLTVKGPVSFSNFDEAALKLISPRGVKTALLGKPIALARGTYTIVMVGQAKDDNILHLFVK